MISLHVPYATHKVRACLEYISSPPQILWIWTNSNQGIYTLEKYIV